MAFYSAISYRPSSLARRLPTSTHVRPAGRYSKQARIELLQRDPKALAFLAVRIRCVQRSLRQRVEERRGKTASSYPAPWPQPMDYYPTSNSIMHAQPAATTSKGSFGPVFAVLAVISVLAVAACIAGRLCGRRFSRKRSSADELYYGSNAVGGDLEKGFEVNYPAMKPMASSRAMVHDIEDGFEIKFTPGKPAAWKSGSKADNKGHQQHQRHSQLGMPKEYAGFRYPAAANGVARQGQIRGGTFIPAKPST